MERYNLVSQAGLGVLYRLGPFIACREKDRGLGSPDIVTDSIHVMEAGGDAIIVEIVSHDRDNLADEERSAVIAVT